MKLFSSAYNVWPADETARLEFVRELTARDWVSGLELGYFDSVSWPAGAPAELPVIISGVPGTTGHNAKDPDFGLASPDAAGLERAREWTRGLAAAVKALVAEGHIVRAVELHSAPTGKADPEVFAASLLELASWDWAGAELWVEHCDAHVEGQEPNKGYLTLEQELAVLDQVSAAAPDTSWGMVINWARSAIEGRSAATAQAHIEQAAASGWLRHLGFSSCSGEQTAFGVPWVDAHLPLAGTSVAPAGTLLGLEQVRAALAGAGEVTYGLKMGLRPEDLSVADRLAALDEAAELIASA